MSLFILMSMCLNLIFMIEDIMNLPIFTCNLIILIIGWPLMAVKQQFRELISKI